MQNVVIRSSLSVNTPLLCFPTFSLKNVPGSRRGGSFDGDVHPSTLTEKLGTHNAEDGIFFKEKLEWVFGSTNLKVQMWSS